MIAKLKNGTTLMVDDDNVFETVFKGEQNLQMVLDSGETRTIAELSALLTAENTATVQLLTDEGTELDTLTGYAVANVTRRIAEGAFRVTVTLYKDI